MAQVAAQIAARAHRRPPWSRTMDRAAASMLLAAAVVVAWNTRSQAMELPEITSETEEGFHDLVFALVSQPNQRTLRVKGKHKGVVVGFEVRLGPTWKAGKVEDINLTTYQGEVVIASMGGDSDELARAMDKLYETKLAPRGLNAKTRFTAISLGGNPQDLKLGPVKMKLFFESHDEHRYAEAFLNIDVAAGRVELREKDPDYRRPLVLALGANTKQLSH